MPSTGGKPARNEPEGNHSGRRLRAPYIQRACIECKRRKQRCSGHDPCKNCQGRSVECVYAAPDGSLSQFGGMRCLKTVRTQIDSLGELVESMQDEIRSLKSSRHEGNSTIEQHSSQDEFRPILQDGSKKRKLQTPDTLAVSPPQEPGPRYQGSTSAEYSLELTRMQLSQIQNPVQSNSSHFDACYNREECDSQHIDFNNDGLSPPPDTQFRPGRLERVSVRGFSEISHQRARELVILYSEAVGPLHPIVDIPLVLSRVDEFYAQLNNGNKECGRQTGRYDVVVIRLILVIALLSEQKRNVSLIENCYEGVEQELNNLFCSEKVSLRGVILVLLGSLYHLFSDRIRMAWRLCGTAASLAMELGLHRPETFQRSFPNDEERLKALRVMWSIFILDHGWSSALGLPRNIDDTALDGAQIPPHDSPYLRAMSSYCNIGSKIVGSTSKIPVNEELYEEEKFMFLNYQIDRWQQSSLANFPPNPADELGLEYNPLDPVQTLLYLRANQLRILLLRPLFFSQSPVKPDQARLLASLEAASRTISAISRLHATTDFYRKQYPFFSHLLTSAVSLLFLIITFQSLSCSLDQENALYLPHDTTQPLKDALELTSAYQAFSIHAAQLHQRLVSIVGLLVRLKILPCDISTLSSEKKETSALQGPLNSPFSPFPLAPEGFDLTIYDSPARTVPRMSPQQFDAVAGFSPFGQQDPSQIDAFLNEAIWNELDKLLVGTGTRSR